MQLTNYTPEVTAGKYTSSLFAFQHTTVSKALPYIYDTTVTIVMFLFNVALLWKCHKLTGMQQ
jgi:hypothetical protein